MIPLPESIKRPLRPAYHRTKEFLGIMRWAISNKPVAQEKRLLMVYDLSSQPFSIGDILVLQEASLVLREQHALDLVDFALVYNPKHPAVNDPAFASITEQNVLYHLATILPVAQVNPYLGSLLLFNSHRHLIRFIADNADRYYIWPPTGKFIAREYLYYTIFNEIIYNYYNEQGRIPYLSCRQNLMDWAYTFYRERVYPHTPVTVNIRNNRFFHTERNSKLEAWIEFFQYCETRYPIKFIIICAKNEIDERMSQCSNVIVAKAHDTDVEQDLALIATSAIHLGASSGPATMALFSSKPYLSVNTTMILPLYRGVIQHGNFLHFYFAGPLQQLTFGAETTDLLVTEFQKIWSVLQKTDWWAERKASPDESERPLLSWLR
jgi:hypothetical protein